MSRDKATRSARCFAFSALLILIISVITTYAATARADDGQPTVVKPVVDCPVRPGVEKALPGADLISCKITKGNPNRPAPTDEFVVSAKTDDGTKYEVRLTRDNKITATMKLLPHADRIESNGAGMALLFWAFAAATIGGALFVVTRRNLIAAVMGMVGSFLGISAVYMMLYANFLAVVQMLVYAGAIMVLFVFVVMILNRPEDEPVAPSGRAGQALGALAIVYLVGRLILMLMKVKAPAAAMLAPLPINDQMTPCVGDTSLCHDFGSVKAVGLDLFNGGLFPFEAISILLLVAVVGAVAIARPLHMKDDDPEAPDPDAGGQH